MQITVTPPGLPEPSVVLTARVLDTENPCGICEQRQATWFDDPATVTAMDTSASPLASPDVCDECLNRLLEQGQLEVVNVDTASF